MAKIGKPLSYTKEVGDEICRRLAEGESLRSICLDEDMPCKSVVFTWLHNLPHYRDQYSHAREKQAETLFDECLDISDNGSNDWMIKKNRKGDEFEVPNHEVIQRSKLRVETRLHMIKILAPKKFGDVKRIEQKIEQEVTAEVNAKVAVSPDIATKLAEVYGDCAKSIPTEVAEQTVADVPEGWEEF